MSFKAENWYWQYHNQLYKAFLTLLIGTKKLIPALKLSKYKLQAPFRPDKFKFSLASLRLKLFSTLTDAASKNGNRETLLIFQMCYGNSKADLEDISGRIQ